MRLMTYDSLYSSIIVLGLALAILRSVFWTYLIRRSSLQNARRLFFSEILTTEMRLGIPTVSLPPPVLFQISRTWLPILPEMITSTSPVHSRPEVKCHCMHSCASAVRTIYNATRLRFGLLMGIFLLACESPPAQPSGLELASLLFEA